MLPRLVLWAALQGSPACTCPCAPTASSLLPTPRTEAWELNRQGRDLYRQRRWAEARQRYAGALTADPEFLGPRLNVATAHAQEGRTRYEASPCNSLDHRSEDTTNRG